MNKSLSERRSMIDKACSTLSLTNQCHLLGLHKSGLYYKPIRESSVNLDLMELIDKQYLRHPHMGVPGMTEWIRKTKGYQVNSKRIARLYKLMGLQSMAPGPHTSKGNKSHKKYPYLLRELIIDQVNQVWSTDITYIRMRHGFMYLMAVIDVRSRYILGWSVSNTMESEWCRDTIRDCVDQHGCPQIVNTDQGSQFTSEVFTSYLINKGITISMDGKGRATDNIYIERFWRSIKYEDIYLRVYDTSQSLHLGIIEYMSYYNDERLHSSLEYRTPKSIFEQNNKIEILEESENPKSAHPLPLSGVYPRKREGVDCSIN